MCQCCEIARDCPKYAMFCPSCIHCGARIIQQLASLPISTSECSARRKAMLYVWLEQGHNEVEIRRLVKGSMALGPEQSTESVNQNHKKRR